MEKSLTDLLAVKKIGQIGTFYQINTSLGEGWLRDLVKKHKRANEAQPGIIKDIKAALKTGSIAELTLEKLNLPAIVYTNSDGSLPDDFEEFCVYYVNGPVIELTTERTADELDNGVLSDIEYFFNLNRFERGFYSRKIKPKIKEYKGLDVAIDSGWFSASKKLGAEITPSYGLRFDKNLNLASTSFALRFKDFFDGIVKVNCKRDGSWFYPTAEIIARLQPDAQNNSNYWLSTKFTFDANGNLTAVEVTDPYEKGAALLDRGIAASTHSGLLVPRKLTDSDISAFYESLVNVLPDSLSNSVLVFDGNGSVKFNYISAVQNIANLLAGTQAC